MMRYSSPSSFTSLPEYSPKRIRSPCLTAEGRFFAVLGHPAGPDRDHLALLRLLLGAVGNDDAAVLLLVLGEALDEQAVAAVDAASAWSPQPSRGW
mgnify:CR=1 FL=1